MQAIQRFRKTLKIMIYAKKDTFLPLPNLFFPVKRRLFLQKLCQNFFLFLGFFFGFTGITSYIFL